MSTLRIACRDPSLQMRDEFQRPDREARVSQAFFIEDNGILSPVLATSSGHEIRAATATALLLREKFRKIKVAYKYFTLIAKCIRSSGLQF